MTVCLITPPSAFLLDERVFPSLGILKVAASLEGAGYAVEHVDCSGIENYLDAVRDQAEATEATVFGITATTPQIPAAIRIAETVRELRPDARLILGGPHVTLVAAARKKHPGGRAEGAWETLEAAFDVLIPGDGEEAVLEALRRPELRMVDGDDPKTAMFLTSSALDTQPYPARHLVDMESYHYTIDGERAHSMIAQLGCPFACSFCGGRASPMLRRVRTRTTSSVVGEITHLHDHYGVRGMMLYDDELNVNPRMVELMEAITEAQRARGVEFRLRGFIKSQLFTAKQADAMRAAGFRWILVGFESGSERILDNINKKATRDENSRCLRIAHDAGLKVKALMSIGHAGESAQTVEDTRQWLLQERPDDFDVTIITTYPGCPYYDDAVETAPGVWTYTAPRTGDRLHSYEVDFTQTADYYKGDPDGGYRAYVFTDRLAADELVMLRDVVEKDVRKRLNIPFNAGHAAMRYEHSMGMGLPGNILRRSAV